MTTRFTAPIGAEPTIWEKAPTADQIRAVGQALDAGTQPTDEEQQAWFGAVVFNEPPTLRGERWHIGNSSFSPEQIVRAVADGRRMEGN